MNKGRGYIYKLKYHVVWCVKYRHKILKNNIEEKLKELLINIAKEHGFIIEEMETDLDHIHLLIECKPQHYIPTLIKSLKGVSARRLFKEFPELKSKLWGGHLWNPTYFIFSVGETNEDQIKQYIKNQKQC